MLSLRKFARVPVTMTLMLLASSTAFAQDPVIVVSAKSVDGLLGDVKYVLTAGGSPQLGDLVDGLIDQFTQGKGLAGVDQRKTFGAYMGLSAAGTPDIVVFVPVNDQKAFRDLLASFFPRQQEVSGGMFSVQAEGQQFYGKFAHGYCFMSLLPAALNRVADPAKIVKSRYAIGIEADLSKIPDDVKDGLLEQAEAAAENATIDRPKPENEVQARLQERGQKMAMEMLRMLLKETDRLSIGLDIDQKSKLVALDLSVVAKSGSSLATSLASYGKTSSAFAGLVGPNAAASVTFAMPLSTEMRELMRETIKGGLDDARARIEKSDKVQKEEHEKAAKEMFDRVSKVLEASGDIGKVDGAIVLNSVAGDKAQIVAAGKIAQGDELAKIIEDFVKAHVDSPNATKVKLDVAKHGGARIHEIANNLEGDSQDKFGSGPGHLAIRDDAVYLAVGGDSLAAVKAAIDQTNKPAGGKRPPVSARVQPSKVIAIFGTGDDPNLALARQAFTGDGDHVSLELLPLDRGARLRLEFGEGFIRFIGLVANQQFGGSQ